MVDAKPKSKKTDAARAWALENGVDLPGAELPPVARTLLTERTAAAQEATARPPKVNKKDMLRLGFDPDLGLVADPSAPPVPDRRTAEQAEQALRRWDTMAGQVAERLRELKATVEVARRALAERGISSGSRHLVEDAPGLEELERLSSALWPWGWEKALEDWFRGEAMRRVEERARPLWEAEKRAGKLGVLVLPAQEPFPAKDFLDVWRSQDPRRAGHVPPDLTPELLDAIAENVNRGGGRSGGYTPARAVELAKLGAHDPQGLRSELARVTTKKTHRAKKTALDRAKRKP